MLGWLGAEEQSSGSGQHSSMTRVRGKHIPVPCLWLCYHLSFSFLTPQLLVALG